MTSTPPQPERAPLVSVLIPAYNYGRLIGATLDAVRSQSLADWECIVVDDGSTDETAAVVGRYAEADNRIRCLRQRNRGQPAARNAALAEARGRYVQLLDADDLIESEKLRVQSAFLEAHPSIDVVYGDVRYFRSDAPRERRLSLFGSAAADEPWMPRTSGTGPALVRALLEANIMVINAPLVRRTLLDRVGGFDEHLARADDWDMWLRCALAGARFEFRDDPGTLSLVRAHTDSLTRRDRRLIESVIRIRRKVSAELQDENLRSANDASLEWLERVRALAVVVDSVVPPQTPFVLVDEDKVRPELIGYPAIPFPERNGHFAGAPANGDDAVEELERCRRNGAAFIVFAWTAMWYLQAYTALREHLEANHACNIHTGDVLIYRLETNADHRERAEEERQTDGPI